MISWLLWILSCIRGGFKDDEWAESEVYIHLSDYVKELESVMRDIAPTEDQ